MRGISPFGSKRTSQVIICKSIYIDINIIRNLFSIFATVLQECYLKLGMQSRYTLKHKYYKEAERARMEREGHMELFLL